MPDPLHPAVVHFPIVLACLAPWVALWGFVRLRRGRDGSAWRAAIVVLALVVVTGWAGMRTGQAQEDRVEHVVPERAIHAHEEAAERLVFGALFLTVLSVLGALRKGGTAEGLRVLVVVGSFVLAVLALDTGRRGGALVYEHGAAAAYAKPAPAGGLPAHPARPDDDDD